MNIFKQTYWAIKEISIFFECKKRLKQEAADPNSEYNHLGLNHNKFNTICFVLSIPSEFKDISIENKMKYLFEKEKQGVYVDYISKLGYGEFYVPDIEGPFIDQETMNPTNSFLIIYDFVFNNLSFKLLFVWLSIFVLFGLGISLINF